MFLRKLCNHSIFSVFNKNNKNLRREENNRQNQSSYAPTSRETESEVISHVFRYSNSQQGHHQHPIELSNNHQILIHQSENFQQRITPAPSPPPSYSTNCPPSASVAVNHSNDNLSSFSANSEDSDSDEGFQQSYELNDAYCPDLLHACSLILQPHQRNQQVNIQPNSHQINEVPFLRRSLSFSSLNYVEIDDICAQFSQSTETSVNNGISNEIQVSRTEQNKQEEEQCTTESLGEAMGQSLSLRKPRISMTWVLREQQQSNNSADNKNGNNNIEKKKIKNAKNKDEKLLNEKLVNSHTNHLQNNHQNNHNHNLQEYQEKREPSKDLFFVCSPQKRASETSRNNEVQLRKRNETRKTTDRRSFYKVANSTLEKYETQSTVNEDLKSLKGTYSEPSLIAASEGNPRRHHRHRRRRDRNRLQKFGYEIRNVDEFLSRCSLSSPGNIPVVLSSSSTLYQTRPGGYQIEIPLPLGMVVNAVFKNQNWLYVQTPHAEEGYVGYTSCLPLGILPPQSRTTSSSTSAKPTPCWETNRDVFPKPSGNMTDTEKEVRLRGGTRSDGARTPRSRRLSSYKGYEEHHVDKLYLRAASQPRLTEKSYAHLRSTNTMCQQHYSSSLKLNNDYAVPQNKEQSQQHQRHHQQSKHQHHTSRSSSSTKKSCPNARTKSRNLRQTLVAISNDFSTDNLTVKKGDIVTLLNCKESKDKRQWFYIKTRDGKEGFIPAEHAGHGFL